MNVLLLSCPATFWFPPRLAGVGRPSLGRSLTP